MIEHYAWPLLQLAAEFKALAILSGKANGVNSADSQGGEVVQNRAGTAGLGPYMNDVVDGQIRLERDFLFGRIDFEITIEAKISNDRDAELRVLPGDELKPKWVHERERVCHR
jgi:hypothetical protein